MKIEMVVNRREIRGTQAVKFEIMDIKHKTNPNQGTLIIGKAGIRWLPPKGSVNAKGKSWNEVIDWLREHGRPVKMQGKSQEKHV